MPHSKAPFSKPMKAAIASPGSSSGIQIETDVKNEWTLAGRWELRPAPEVSEAGEVISQPAFSAKDWWTATVPGTGLNHDGGSKAYILIPTSV